MPIAGFQSASVRIAQMSKRYGKLSVLRNIDLNIAAGEIICLLGPSGCGKTTLLRLIAGLETLEGGDIFLNDTRINDLPVHQRGFGLMFQDHALFPHMNVGRNIAFGLKMRRASADEQAARVRELLALVDMTGYEGRDVATLSGGEKQRVALARSLAPNPPLLMLDEPLGALDAALRERLILDLRDIIKRIGLTAIYVTHDRQEAFAIADRVAVMNAGQIEQIAPPHELYNRPATAFVARFIGLQNLFPVISLHAGIAQTDAGEFPTVDSPKTILIHPDGIRIAADDQGLVGVISAVRFEGSTYQLEVTVNSGARLIFDHPAYDREPLQKGDRVTLQIDENAVIPLES